MTYWVWGQGWKREELRDNSRSLGGGNGNSLQYSCMENPKDRRNSWTTVHGVTKNWTWLSDLACMCHDESHHGCCTGNSEIWLDCEYIFQSSSVAQSCLTLCDPMNRNTPGLCVHHQLPDFSQTHVHWVGDAIQPSQSLLSTSPPALNFSQHQGLFKWVSCSLLNHQWITEEIKE